MTRILSLGQNKGLTIMILNLAPTRPYHLDSLSSLTFANRTKKIEVREIENEPVVKGNVQLPSLAGPHIQRQPLRPLHSISLNAIVPAKQQNRKPKSFSVYSDGARVSAVLARMPPPTLPRQSSPLKRPSDSSCSSVHRPAKRRLPFAAPIQDCQPQISKRAIEDLVEKKVTDILAARALDQPLMGSQPEISHEVQQRLDMLEKRIEGKEDGREQGLTFLFMARQHAVRGEEASALRMYCLARDFFPNHEKLESKIARLQEKVNEVQKGEGCELGAEQGAVSSCNKDVAEDCRAQTLLDIVNSGDMSRIRKLKGVGVRKAEAIQEGLGLQEYGGEPVVLKDLKELSDLKGVGIRAVQNMMAGL